MRISRRGHQPAASLVLAALLGVTGCQTPLPPELDVPFEEAARRAETTSRAHPAYEEAAKKKARPRLFRGAIDCGLVGHDLSLVLAVNADGTVAATYVDPSNAKTRCLARRARTAKLPPPPSAPLFVGASTASED